MDKKKVKVYTYTRVSTTMQIDGYSLDAQKSRMKAFAEYNDYEIVREYEDAGKSGKSIEGRVQFSQMMDDIKEGKDGVSYVLVFKLSRFGRNAADVLSTLQIMQDFGVNLICVEDGIDSSKDAGKLMISVLSAVAEIERENIRVQTMEGRIQKAREGKWNGGFAPYGYQLVDGKLEINEEEAVAIRVIFDQYVNTNIGSNGIAKYLENHGIRKIQRQNGKNPLFDAHLVRLILRNPVYCGKIAYGRRRTEKVHGTRNDYHLVEQENYLLVDGLHEAIVSEEIWQAAQVKLLAQAKKYEHVNKGKDTRTHLLSGIVKCPVCGAGMYGNKCIKHKKDGTKYKDFYYYGCKHRTMTRGHKCDYRKQINEELLDDAVAEIIVALVSKPKFATMMQEKINMKVDTSTIDQEVANHEKQLRQYYSTKSKLMEEIDSLDPDDRHYIKRKADLDDRLYRMYDKIEEEENLLVEARAKKQAIEAEKLTADNIYKVLIYFEKLYGVMNDVERRRFIEALISEIQIFPERQPNGQWLKSIKFKLPIIGENMELSLDNDKHVDKADVLTKVVDNRLGGLCHALHQLFLCNAPHVVRTRYRVDLSLADAAVRTADTDILVRAAKTAHHMSLEMRQHEQRIIVEDVLAHMHFREPLTVFNRQRCYAVLIHDVHRAERPAVYLQGLAVLRGRVAVALVIGVGLNDVGFRQVVFDQRFHPRARDDVGAVRFAGVQLDAGLAGQAAAHAAENTAQAFRRQIPREVNDGFFPRALRIRDIVVTISAGNRFLICHCISSSCILPRSHVFFGYIILPGVCSKSILFCKSIYRPPSGGYEKDHCPRSLVRPVFTTIRCYQQSCILCHGIIFGTDFLSIPMIPGNRHMRIFFRPRQAP